MLSEIPQEIQRQISSSLHCTLKNFSHASGGCINHGGQLTTSKGFFFIKWNSASRFPKMFEAEMHGLNYLRKSTAIRIPEVVVVGDAENVQFIVLEFIRQGKASGSFSKDLAEGLAQIHHCSSNTYGLASDNYIGSLPQFNKCHDNWIDFFVSQRLSPQVKLAIQSGRLPRDIEFAFEKLYERLPNLLAKDRPSLMHGDLWSGNVIIDEAGAPCLIDPAIYFGHREVEIAFTKLFGGFPPEFYRWYNTFFPLPDGHESRVELHNLYPLLVHVNLFGGGYSQQVVSILNQFV